MEHCGLPKYLVNKIGRVTTAGIFRGYPIPTPSSQLGGIKDLSCDTDMLCFLNRRRKKSERSSWGCHALRHAAQSK